MSPAEKRRRDEAIRRRDSGYHDDTGMWITITAATIASGGGSSSHDHGSGGSSYDSGSSYSSGGSDSGGSSGGGVD